MDANTTSSLKPNWMGIIGWVLAIVGLVPIFILPLPNDGFKFLMALIWLPGLMLASSAISKNLAKASAQVETPVNEELDLPPIREFVLQD